MRVWERIRLPLRSLFGSRNVLYYHSSNPGTGYSLFRRISPLGNPNDSVVPILDQWVKEGNPVDHRGLQFIINELSVYYRYKHALQVSQWMTDKRYMCLSTRDVATRLDLILQVHGLDKAENYFSNIPRQLKSFVVYTSLLKCYAQEKSLEKAEAVMQQIREKFTMTSPVCYNILINMYYQNEQHEKLDSLISEMEEKGISFDQYTFGVRLSSCAATSDIEGIDKIIEKAESYPGLVLPWNFYSIAARGYLKVGIEDKALTMLKKLEKKLLPTAKRRTLAFVALFQLYARTGKREELYRVWNLYKKGKVYNKGYRNMISSLLMIDDIEGAEKICEEWESSGLSFEIYIPELLFSTYCAKGFLGKAEALMDKGIAKGVEPSAEMWYRLASLYLENNHIAKTVEALKKLI